MDDEDNTRNHLTHADKTASYMPMALNKSDPTPKRKIPTGPQTAITPPWKKERPPKNSCETNPTTADSNLLCAQGPQIGRQWALLCTRDQDFTQRQQNYAGGKPTPAGTNGERNAKRKEKFPMEHKQPGRAGRQGLQHPLGICARPSKASAGRTIPTTPPRPLGAQLIIPNIR